MIILKDWIPGRCLGWHSFEVWCVLFQVNLFTIPPSNICAFYLRQSAWTTFPPSNILLILSIQLSAFYNPFHYLRNRTQTI